MTKKTYKPNGQPHYLACTCCGAGLVNTPEENACYHEIPYPQDTKFGQCRSCFGTITAETTLGDLNELTDAQVWKKIGWAAENFYKSRIEILRDKLNEKNATGFDAFPLWKKLLFVQNAVEKGLII